LTFEGETKTIHEWAKIKGIDIGLGEGYSGYSLYVNKCEMPLSRGMFVVEGRGPETHLLRVCFPFYTLHGTGLATRSHALEQAIHLLSALQKAGKKPDTRNTKKWK
jgi:hypothetical protein